ncbi:MAG: ATP-binding protein [Dysgonamonadaceae bacterium]|nr:ATP-binding protein [Dysgonamonadaceae bacterium]
MDKQLKKLPTGTQTFEIVREMDCVYVDKTKYLVNIIENGRIYFFARPRRFGKSLTLTTLEAMFRGKKELFKGLDAEAWMNRPDFVKYPVIRLSLNKVTTKQGLDLLNASLMKHIWDTASLLNVTVPESSSAGDLFDDLIINLYKKHSEKVVVLIDEYDKPYIDYFDEPEEAEKVRDILANLYVRIKGNDEYLRFVLLTGISKFARLGVFSKLNNLTDISMSNKYATLCGITRDELLQNFSGHLELTAEEMQITKDELVEKMEDIYDGFSFNGKVRLYNPYSTLRFFEDKSFENYWFDSGTSTMIAKYLKNKNLTVEQFRNYPVALDFARNPGEMDSTPPEGFLYQGGFLTLREGITDDFALDYPNKEVLHAMSRLVTQKYLEDRDESWTRCRSDLLRALFSIDCETFVSVLNRLLANIPYTDFDLAARQSISDNAYKLTTQEWLYRSSILAFFQGCGVIVFGELQSSKGRSDIVLSHKGNIWVIEIKVAFKDESPAAKAEEAVRQIFEKNYNKPYPNAICVGLAIDDGARQITEYRMVNGER